MTKPTVPYEYYSDLKTFVEHLQVELQRSKAHDVLTVSVYVEMGRKFDKIMVVEHRMGVPSEAKPRYFVAKKSGTHYGSIYGALSPLAPNMRWYFGTLDSYQKWDWAGYHARPRVSLREAGVMLIGHYGAYEHYEKIMTAA